jgi:cyclophilin family peptidyl-prolyl cis-trans isomerase
MPLICSSTEAVSVLLNFGVFRKLTSMLLGLLLVTQMLAGKSCADEHPRLADEKIVMRTIAGDLVLGLYPDVAPQHVAQLIRLVEAGVYDGTHFYRLHPGFVLQTSTAEDRLIPMESNQAALIHPIPAEFSARLHRRGVLSMARADGDPNSADTSFSILLGDAPHLDRNYTVFGELLAGWDVIEEFQRVPSNEHCPAVRLTINSVRISRDPSESILAQRAVATPVAIPAEIAAVADAQRLIQEPWNERTSPLLHVAIVGLLITAILNVIVCLSLWWFRSFRVALSLLLISTLFAYICFVMTAIPIGRREPLIGLGILIGLVSQFKLMSLFDRCEQPRKMTSGQPA